MKMNRIALRSGSIVALLMVLFCLTASPAYAFISYPDSNPSIEQIDAYRNVLETGDFLIIVYENTPYATTPDTNYSEAFIWRLYDTNGTTEIAQASGYNYNARGYGYNVISFYLSATEVAAAGFASYPDYWEKPYYIKLSGTLSSSSFAIPPSYNFQMAAGDYSSETDTADVKVEVADRIIDIAADLDNRWDLSVVYSLLEQTEASTVLSIYGQAFFRGAIHGIQAMAPSAFSISIQNVNVADRTWTTTYITDLEAQSAGTYIETATTAGKTFLNVDYNLMGILIITIICLAIIFANWYIAGGNIYRGMVEASPALVIGSRMALFGLGEIGLIAAICWLYISGKIWKVF